jgi:transposase
LYCGIDLHARTMSLCILNQAGEILVHRKMPAGPEPFLHAVAPSRTDLVVCVAGIFPWDWLADLCARAEIPFVLGHALSMTAIHGGKAKTDTSDAQNIAVLLRGGRLPQADVYPAEMRATRELLRRRIHLMRTRAELLAPIQNPNSQSNLPEIGQQSAYKANRAGVAERCPEPAGQKSIAVDLALSDHYDRLLRDVEVSIGHTAKHPNANTLYLLRTVPGIGAILRLVLRYAIHDIQRFPRVQDCVSSCRLVKCAKESAGKRAGTAGPKLGNASLKGAFSDAAVLFRRSHSAGQTYLTRLEKQPGKGTALTVLAPKLARAVYYMLKRHTAFEMQTVLQG